jgi:hypothetical protein
MRLFAVASALLAVSVRGNEVVNGSFAASEEDHGSLRSLATRKNHAVCYQILNTWWSDRWEEKVRGAVNDMDSLCEVWNNSPRECNVRSERKIRPGMTQKHMDAACTNVGAHSPNVCQGNPCNSLNSGDCTLQGSSGRCQWFTSAMISKTNAHRKTQGWPLMPTTVGCYRNPCNMPGYGKQSDATCQANGVPGLFTCTWCKGGPSDPKLNGKGMGCQQVVPTSIASCAPVNSKSIDKKSIFKLRVNGNCQCSAEFPLCKVLVDDRATEFVARFP